MSDKIGIYVCECGPNIASRVHIDKIMEDLAKLEDFKDKELVIKNHKLLCSVDGKKFLEDEINENGFSHLVLAACSPRDHDTTFINVCKKTKLNPYMYRIINIREQCAWVYSDKDVATEKAVRYIHAGMNRVLYQKPLNETELDSNPDVLVIGGGTTGIEAALSSAGENRKIFLIEKEENLGDLTSKLKELLPRQGSNLNVLKQRISDVQNNKNIRIFTNTELESIVGFLGNFEIVLKNKKSDETTELLVGAVVMANGAELQNPQELTDFNFQNDDNVFTAQEVEEMFSQSDKLTLRNGNEPKSVALVHCVGRKDLGYCSKICCNYLQKIAHYINEQSNNIEITEFYKHLCLPNKEDQEYHQKITDKVNFVRITDISLCGTELNLTKINGENSTLKPDMVILATGIIPAKDNPKFAKMLKVDLDERGFFNEAHLKKDPISTNTDGVFIAGTTKGPAGISESILQAQACAGKILTQLIPGQKIIPEVMVSEILEAYCRGCKTCLDVCGFGAIYFDKDKGISIVNEAICRGCGNCVGSCPSGSIRTKYFTNPQLYQEVKEALR